MHLPKKYDKTMLIKQETAVKKPKSGGSGMEYTICDRDRQI